MVSVPADCVLFSSNHKLLLLQQRVDRVPAQWHLQLKPLREIDILLSSQPIQTSKSKPEAQQNTGVKRKTTVQKYWLLPTPPPFFFPNHIPDGAQTFYIPTGMLPYADPDLTTAFREANLEKYCKFIFKFYSPEPP